MPLFNDELVFLHIPKSGGTSVERFLVDQGYTMKLFTSTGSVFVNGHTPQHCTFRELQELNLLAPRIFTILRPEEERVLSEYFYILQHRPDLRQRFQSFDEFLDLFLDYSNRHIFDYHNLSNRDFLLNSNGDIDPRIHLFQFFDVAGIEAFLGLKGLANYHEFKTEKTFQLDSRIRRRIKDFYEQNRPCPYP